MPPPTKLNPVEAEDDKDNLITLRRDLKTAFKARENCDVTIKLSNGETLECHRAILCSRSTFFANALKPGRFKEGTTGTIEMLDDPPAAIKALAEFLYTADYKVATISKRKKASNTLMHIAEVYAVAAIYDAPQLLRRMHRHFHTCYFRISFLTTFPRAIKHIYEWVPDEQCAIRHDESILKSCMTRFGAREKLRNEVEELVPEFVEHLTASAVAFWRDDCDEAAAAWLTAVDHPDMVSVENGMVVCPRCKNRVYVEYPMNLLGSKKCERCHAKISSEEWGACEFVDRKEDYGWDTDEAEEMGFGKAD